MNGSIDRLSGLKENVIIGRLIPARLDQTSQGRERLGVEEGEREDGRLTGFTKAPATFEEALAAIGGGDLVGVGAENSDLKPTDETDETDGSVSNDITDDGGLLAAVSALADVAAGGVESSDSGDDAAARAAEALRASTSTVEENTDSSPQFVDEVNEDESDKSDQ